MQQNKSIKRKFPAIWQAASALVAMVLLLFAVTIVAGIVIVILKIPLDFGINMLLLALTQLLVMLPVAFAFLYFAKNDVTATVRLKKGVNPLQILLLVGVGIGALFFANGINSIFLEFLKSLGYKQLPNMVPEPQNLVQMVSGVLVIAVLPAFCEEFMFRGLVMRAFERYSPIVAGLVSALLFGVMHGTFEQVLFAFILGIILSYVVLLADSLWAAFTIHFFNNAAAVVLLYFMKDQSSPNVDPISFAMLYIILGVVGLAISLPLFTLYTRHRNRKLYGAPLPVELVKKPIVRPVKNMFVQYLPLFLFFGIQLLQMIVIWVFPELFSKGQ